LPVVDPTNSGWRGGRGQFSLQYGTDPLDIFPSEFEILDDCGLIALSGNHIRLTRRGIRHRDVAVQVFVFDQVRDLARSLQYLTVSTKDAV